MITQRPFLNARVVPQGCVFKDPEKCRVGIEVGIEDGMARPNVIFMSGDKKKMEFRFDPIPLSTFNRDQVSFESLSGILRLGYPSEFALARIVGELLFQETIIRVSIDMGVINCWLCMKTSQIVFTNSPANIPVRNQEGVESLLDILPVR